MLGSAYASKSGPSDANAPTMACAAPGPRCGTWLKARNTCSRAGCSRGCVLRSREAAALEPPPPWLSKYMSCEGRDPGYGIGYLVPYLRRVSECSVCAPLGKEPSFTISQTLLCRSCHDRRKGRQDCGYPAPQGPWAWCWMVRPQKRACCMPWPEQP